MKKNENKARILAMLTTGPATSKDLATALDLPLPRVQNALSLLLISRKVLKAGTDGKRFALWSVPEKKQRAAPPSAFA